MSLLKGGKGCIFLALQRSAIQSTLLFWIQQPYLKIDCCSCSFLPGSCWGGKSTYSSNSTPSLKWMGILLFILVQSRLCLWFFTFFKPNRIPTTATMSHHLQHYLGWAHLFRQSPAALLPTSGWSTLGTLLEHFWCSSTGKMKLHQKCTFPNQNADADRQTQSSLRREDFYIISQDLD